MNSCCLQCGEKIFENNEFSNCPCCNKCWSRFNGEWRDHAPNRSFRNLVESLQHIVKNFNEDNSENDPHGSKKYAPRGPKSAMHSSVLRDMGNDQGPSTSAHSIQKTPSPGRNKATGIIASPNVQREETIDVDDFF